MVSNIIILESQLYYMKSNHVFCILYDFTFLQLFLNQWGETHVSHSSFMIIGTFFLLRLKTTINFQKSIRTLCHIKMFPPRNSIIKAMICM